MKYLIVGLGNIGSEYANTRHNIGFMMLDAFAESKGILWEDKRYGFVARCRVKSAEIILLKPSTTQKILRTRYIGTVIHIQNPKVSPIQDERIFLTVIIIPLLSDGVLPNIHFL